MGDTKENYEKLTKHLMENFKCPKEEGVYRYELINNKMEVVRVAATLPVIWDVGV